MPGAGRRVPDWTSWRFRPTPSHRFARFSTTAVSATRPRRRRTRPGKSRRSSRLRKRSEEHTSELQSLMRNSYAVFCLKKKNKYTTTHTYTDIYPQHRTENQNTHISNTK